MTESPFAEPSLVDEVEWADLINDLNKKRCVLFLGPTLPVYTDGNDKLDFYSKASLHLSKILAEKNVPFDASQKYNLQYIARKFLTYKKDVRIRLDDEIGALYNAEIEKLKKEGNTKLPDLYKNISSLPWNTIVNTQPDQFLEYAFKDKASFHYYHYKNHVKTGVKNVDPELLLVYNLFGALINENDDYKLESLILTEEDQVDFLRNIIKDNPQIPESVVSRFDETKRYIFLDFNFENWHFRLLLEALKLKKTFLPISSQHLKTGFSYYTKDFYKSRYGFLFVKNNSEEFIKELVEKYLERFPVEQAPSLEHRSMFIAYSDEDEKSTGLLIKHLHPWVERNALDIWFRGGRPPGEIVAQEAAEFESAGCIVLMISADSFSSPFYSNYIIPAIRKATDGSGTHVIAVISRECPWMETAVGQLKHILPEDKKALNTNNGQDADERYTSTAIAISKILW
jgi:hypothetical protein